MFKKTAYTLAEIIIVIGVIGIIIELTVPTLINNVRDKELATRLLKFDTNLQQAILLWKNEIGCNSDAMTCFAYTGMLDNYPNAFDETFGKYMKITDVAYGESNTKDWLPNDTLNYYGDSTSVGYGKVAQTGSLHTVYLLADGTTLSTDFDGTSHIQWASNGMVIYVDVNGKKKPNRIGKDVFPISVGYKSGKDIYYSARQSNNHNITGLCPNIEYPCDTDNINPTKENGANPTMYVILHQKLPDYNALSKIVSGFKP